MAGISVVGKGVTIWQFTPSTGGMCMYGQGRVLEQAHGRVKVQLCHPYGKAKVLDLPRYMVSITQCYAATLKTMGRVWYAYGVPNAYIYSKATGKAIIW